MLTSLYIENIALISKLEIPLYNGFTAITGTTGSGKSLILSILQFALGVKLNDKQSIVYNNQPFGTVVVTFSEISKYIQSFLQENGISFLDDELLIKRIVMPNGTTKCYINDVPCKASTLQSLARLLIEICSQSTAYKNSTDNTFDPTTFVDKYANLEELATEVKQAYTTFSNIKKQRLLLIQDSQNSLALKEYKSTIQEIKALNLQPNEEEFLSTQKLEVEKYGKLNDILMNVIANTGNTKGGAEYALNCSSRILNKTNDSNASQLANRIEKCLEEVRDISATAEELLLKYANDAKKLNDIEERLQHIRTVCRKNNIDSSNYQEVQEYLEELHQKVSNIENASKKIEELTYEEEEATKKYLQLARQLSSQRKENAITLQKSIQQNMEDLMLYNATFKVQITTDATCITQNGIDEIDFVGSLNPGTPYKSINKFASGGEMARLVLAIKASIAKQKSTPTIIFDEIDTGVSGAVANAIGKKMQQLGQNAQVIAITHNHQVAACAEHHIRVSKTSKNVQADTLNMTQKVEEIATMMSATNITDNALQLAQQLLQNGYVPTKTIENKQQ